LPATVAALTVTLNPGDNIQSIINSNAAGTTYYFNAGTYRLQSISAKSGDTYLGATDSSGNRMAVLNGSKIVSGFTQSGSYWVATGQMTSGLAVDANTGYCLPDSPRCMYLNELFFDGVRLKHVGSQASLASGTWYFDTSTNNIWVFANPTGHTVEISVTTYAFSNSGATNVTVQSMVIEKYANSSQTGAINYAAATVRNVEARNNHGTGIRGGSQLLGNYVHHNGQLGLFTSGSNVVVDGNEIAYNNGAGFDPGWEAGGTKFNYSSHLELRNNYVHDNRGPGLWTDYDNHYTTFEGNRTANNEYAGIKAEMSFDQTVRYNILQNEKPAENGTGPYYGAALYYVNTTRGQIYNNLLYMCSGGIMGYRDSRTGTADDGELFGLGYLNVHGNSIVMTSTQQVAAGIYSPAGASYSTSSFQANTYKLDNSAGNYYQWTGLNSYINQTNWRASGADATGTWTTAANFPSTTFTPGSRIQTANSSTTVYSLPSVTDGTLLSTLAAGAPGTVTQVAGPIYTNGSPWWQVKYDNGTTGWTLESSLAGGTGAVAPAITNASSLPPGTVSVAYSYTLTATGTSPITWSVVSGSLPGGLSLDANSGRISGNPNTAGTSSFGIAATNVAGNTQASVSLVINGVAPVITTVSPLPTAAINTAYSAALAASGSTPLSWSITSGALPAGFTLNSASGAISGVPTGAGTFSFTVKVSNAYGASQKTFSITVSGVAPVITTVSPLPAATINTAYSAALAASGSTPLSWSITSGALPAGLTLNSASGAIGGVPTGAGTFNFAVQVSNTYGASQKTFSLTVSGVAPKILTTSLPNGALGVPYAVTLSDTGAQPTTFRVISGALPSGLSLDPNTGRLAGTPNAKGGFSFTIQAANGVAPNATASLSILIKRN
jgi:hypothetical protein